MANSNNKTTNLNTLLAVDNTGSMGQACTCARAAFAEVRAMLSLLMGRPCVDVVTMGDFDRTTPDNHQGGFAYLPRDSDDGAVSAFMDKYVKPMGGGGAPEAYKTGFNHILRLAEVPNIVFLFCDDMPHGVDGERLDNEGQLEKAYIEKNQMIWDWVELCRAVKAANIRVVTFLTAGSSKDIWNQLGDVVVMRQNTADAIGKAMMWTFSAITDQSRDEPDPKLFTVDAGLIEPLLRIDLAAELKDADPLKVIETFDKLLDPTYPQRAMALTTNDILGKYWRLICGKYKYMLNRIYAEQCQRVMDKLSACKDKLPESDKAIMKAWIDRSHDETPMIREIVQKALDDDENKPTTYLTLPHHMRGTIILEDVLELGRGGGFVEVAKVVASLTIVTPTTPMTMPEDEGVAPAFIPMNLGKGVVMSLIANLLSPGVRFSHNETYMVAILALKNKYLSDIALMFLKEHVGTWIKWDLDAEGKLSFPAFWSMNFIRLLNLAPDEVLTVEERTFRDHYLRVAQIVRNHDATISIVTPLMFGGIKPYVTWKRHCSNAGTVNGCGQDRCFTLFPGDSKVCALCINSCTMKNDELYSKPSTIVDPEANKASWAQCYSCKCNYTIAVPDRCNVRPKCHDCRQNDVSQSIECCSCLNRYVNHGGTAIKAMNDALANYEAVGSLKAPKAAIIRNVLASDSNSFVCPRCVETPTESTTTHDEKIAVLIKENPTLSGLVPLTPYDDLMNTSTSLWKRVVKCKATVPAEPSAFVHLTYKNYTVHKPVYVATLVSTTLLDHSGMETCQMCVGDVPVRSMTKACGSCPNRICIDCVRGWYSQVNIGSLVQQGHCMCPFCKSPPVFDTLRNLDVRHLRNLRPAPRNKNQVCEWDHRSIYGVCSSCLNLSVAMPYECGSESLPEIKNFVCTDCTESRRVRRLAMEQAQPQDSSTQLIMSWNTKPCPSCNNDVQRDGGCHHIACACGVHWCWVCNEQFDANIIYDHMADCGGIFPGEDVEDGY